MSNQENFMDLEKPVEIKNRVDLYMRLYDLRDSKDGAF